MPIDHTTGIKQSGAISLGGSSNQKSSGANNDFAGSNIGSEFLGHTAGTEQTSMSELYKSSNSHTQSGGPVPNSDGNTTEGIPTSGEISMGDFYRTSNALDPSDFIAETINARSSNYSSINPNGQYAHGRGGNNSASSAYVTSDSSNECFAITGVDVYNGVSDISTGFDMVLLTTQSSQKNGTPTGLTHSWMVRPYGNSATYTASNGSTSSKSTSTWTEIYKYTWIPTAINDFTAGNTASLQSDFRFAPNHFKWTYVETGGGSGAMTNVLTTQNSGWSTSSGASVANYYMPAVGSTSSTVYTVGDGDGLYSSTTIDDWTRNSVARGFRIYNFLEDECANFYQQKYVTMNAHWFDIKNSSDGTDNGNTNTFHAGYHSHVSPNFTFKITQQMIHYGSC